MADITLQTLQDTLTSLALQVNTLATIVGGNSDKLVVHDAKITELLNPPPLPPPELVYWLGSHSIQEVDLILHTDITNLQASNTSLTGIVSEIESALSQEITDRISGDAALQSDVDELVVKTDGIAADLAAEITARGASDSSFSTKLDNTNSRIDGIGADLSDEKSVRSNETNTLSKSVDTINDQIQTIDAKVQYLSGVGVDPAGALAASQVDATTKSNNAISIATAESAIRLSADTDLKNQLDAISASTSSAQSDVSGEASVRQEADENLQTQIDSTDAKASSTETTLTAETATRKSVDDSLQLQIETNTDDISSFTTGLSDEEEARITADAELQLDLTEHTESIADHTSDIATLQAQVVPAMLKYGVTIDGLGYIKGYQNIGSTLPESKFLVQNINNDVKIQHPSYVGSYFPPIVVIAFNPPVSYSTLYGTAAAQTFHSTDNIDHVRNVGIYTTTSVAANGSVLMGTAYNPAASAFRLGQVNTTFSVRIAGGVNKYLSLWYRIKATTGTATGTWYPVLLADNTISGARTYERASNQGVVTISVPAAQVIEFGLTVLNTVDAAINSASSDFIYGGSVSITAININGI